MNRIAAVLAVSLCLALPGSAFSQQALDWQAFFAEYCAWGHAASCLPAAERAYKQGKTVQEAVEDIAALRGGTIPVEKFSHIAAVSAFQEFMDKAAKLAPADLNRGQTEFKDKPDALLAKFAEIRGECGAIVSLPDKRFCYEQAVAAIIPGRKG
jgi:hypothetical protein